MLPIVGYMLLFFFHCVSPQPLGLNNFPALSNLVKASEQTKDHMLNIFDRSPKKIVLRRKETAPNPLPGGYSDFTGCEESDLSKFATYKFHDNKKTWEEARLACYQEGGHLAFPECKKEEAKYQTILNRVKSGGAWIGVHDMYEEDEWLTVFDDNVDDLKYKNWARGEPDNAGPDGENCGELGEDGLWHDRPCNKQLNYFCKIDLIV